MGNPCFTPERSPLLGNENLLAQAAIRTAPLLRNVFECRTRLDAMFRITPCRIVAVCSTDHKVDKEQLTRYQPQGRGIGNSDADIDAFRDEVQTSLIRNELHIDIRAALEKLGNNLMLRPIQ